MCKERHIIYIENDGSRAEWYHYTRMEAGGKNSLLLSSSFGQESSKSALQLDNLVDFPGK